MKSSFKQNMYVKNSDNIFNKYRNPILFDDRNSIKECFSYFDEDKDCILNQNEFKNVLRTLYTDRNNGEFMSKDKILKLYNYYADLNPKHAWIGIKEFEKFWHRTVKPSLFAKSALIVIDVQNDFIDGTLALRNFPAEEDGIEVIPVINKLITEVPFELIVYTQDWHPDNHISFYENRNSRKFTIKHTKSGKTSVQPGDTVTFEGGMSQKLWPKHCVQYTKGAQFHPKLRIMENSQRSLFIRKGTNSDIDSYSAFYDNMKMERTLLHYELSKRGITDLYVCGLATDVCVAATSLDGLDLNYRVVLIENACRGVEIVNIESAKRKIVEKGGIIVHSNEVPQMVECIERKSNLGYATILNNSLTSFY